MKYIHIPLPVYSCFLAAALLSQGTAQTVTNQPPKTGPTAPGAPPAAPVDPGSAEMQARTKLTDPKVKQLVEQWYKAAGRAFDPQAHQ